MIIMKNYNSFIASKFLDILTLTASHVLTTFSDLATMPVMSFPG